MPSFLIEIFKSWCPSNTTSKFGRSLNAPIHAESKVRFFIPSLTTRLGGAEWVKLFWNLRLLLIPIFLEVPSNFRRNLAIGHPVNGFHTDDASMQFVSHETFLQLALGLTRTHYQNRFCIANTRNDRIIVNVEKSRRPPLAAIICGY